MHSQTTWTKALTSLADKNYDRPEDAPFKAVDSSPLFHGAYGIVSQAIRSGDTEPYAIKRIEGQHDDRRRKIALEVKFLRQLKHPNILKLVEYYTITAEDWHDRYFLVTQPWAPMSLQRFMNKLVDGHKGNYPGSCEWYQPQALNPWPSIAEQCLDGLAYLHSQKPYPIRHKDIKPDNILLHEWGPSRVTPIIIDFGISKEQVGATSTTNSGTYQYLAPEQHRKEKPTEKSDIFSLGCCFAMIEGILSPWPALEDVDNVAYTFAYTIDDINIQLSKLLDTSIRSDHTSKHFRVGFRILVKRMMQGSANDRPSAEEAFSTMQHLLVASELHSSTTSSQTVVSDSTRGTQKPNGHYDRSPALVRSPKRMKLASLSPSRDKTVQFTYGQKLAKTLKLDVQGDRVGAIAFSPKGDRIASGSSFGTIQLWNARTGKEIQRLDAHEAGITAIDFSPNGDTFASASVDKTARLWNVDNCNSIWVFKEHKEYVWEVAFSPDGNITALGSDDTTVQLCSIKTGKAIQILKGHTYLLGLAFSPDCKTLLTASQDNTIRHWNVETGQEIWRLKDCPSFSFTSLFSPDRTTVVSVLDGSTITLWSAKTGEEIWRSEYSHFFLVNAMSFSRNGDMITVLCFDMSIWILEARTGRLIRKLEAQDNGADLGVVAFSPDGNTIATTFSGGPTVRLWDIGKAKAM